MLIRSSRMEVAILAGAALAWAGLTGCAAEVEQPDQAGEQQQTLRDSRGRVLGDISRDVVLSNRDVETTLKLVARVEAQADEIVEFYEPAPGRIVLSGAGAPQAPSRTMANSDEPLDAALVWNELTDGAPMPAELSDALSRAAERLRGPAELRQKPEAPSLEAAPEATTALDTGTRQDLPGLAGAAEAASEIAQTGGWCDTSYFTHRDSRSYNSPLGACPNDSFWDWKVCLNNWWNGAYAKHGDAYFAHASVCPAQGTQVVLRITSDEFGGGIWTVPVNTYRWYQIHDSLCGDIFDDCASFNAYVEHATNDRFHFRTIVNAE